MYSIDHPSGFQNIVRSLCLLNPSVTVDQDIRQLVSVGEVDLGTHGNKSS